MTGNRGAKKSFLIRTTTLVCSLAALFAAAFLFSFAGASVKAASGLTGLQDATTSTPKLAGHWQLNKDQSDDVRQKMQAARGDSGGGQGGGGGRGRNGEGRGQGGGMMDDLQLLTINQNGTNVKVTGKSGRVLAQYPNDAGAEKNAGGEGESQRTTTSQWQNGQLTVVTQSPRGKSTRTYSLSPDGKQLYVTIKMENERLKEPLTYRLVYDPASAASN
jgi:hypothetical protein